MIYTARAFVIFIVVPEQVSNRIMKIISNCTHLETRPILREFRNISRVVSILNCTSMIHPITVYREETRGLLSLAFTK